MAEYDCIIIGGGPAGLSAALVLGRARRKIIVLDHGHYRNECSHELHGYLTRDGITPQAFRAAAREDLTRYGVVIRPVEARNARKIRSGFEVSLSRGQSLHSKMLLVATGLRDRLPQIEGFSEIYGTSAHHCPHCDGWEWRDKPIAILGRGHAGAEVSLKLQNWSRNIILCTNGPSSLTPNDLQRLKKASIPIRTDKIARLESRKGFLSHILFTDGSKLKRSAIFFTLPQDPSCLIASELGCAMTKKGLVKTDSKQRTNIPGLFVAGDAVRDMHFAIVAAAEGAKAAVAINDALTRLTNDSI